MNKAAQQLAIRYCLNVALFLLGLIFLIWFTWFRKIPFDSVNWKKEKHRFQMADDLERRLMAERWSKQKVITELGIDRAPGIYPILYEPGCYAAVYGLDLDHTLDIAIGKDGIVTGVEVVKGD